jgi:hypothetical protein
MMPSITIDAAGLWPGEWLLLPFISVIKVLREFNPIGKSVNLEYFGPKNPHMIRKMINIPTIYPTDE